MSQSVLKLTPEEAREIPMVDLAFAVLKNTNNPMYYRDLMQEIANIKGISDEEAMQVIAQVYTEINIDGRFACVGNNLWGLKRWYPVERSEDAMGGVKHPRIINDDDDDDLDDESLFADETEEYVSDDDDFERIDDESEDLFDGDADDLDEEVDEEIEEEIESEDLDDEDIAEDLDELSEDLDEEDSEDNDLDADADDIDDDR